MGPQGCASPSPPVRARSVGFVGYAFGYGGYGGYGGYAMYSIYGPQNGLRFNS